MCFYKKTQHKFNLVNILAKISQRTYRISKLGSSENSGGRYPDKLLLSSRLQRAKIHLTKYGKNMKREEEALIQKKRN